MCVSCDHGPWPQLSGLGIYNWKNWPVIFSVMETKDCNEKAASVCWWKLGLTYKSGAGRFMEVGTDIQPERDRK